MLKPILLLALLTLTIHSCVAQKPTIQEQLEHAKDSKLLIIHADDLGVAHSENMASISAFEKAMVSPLRKLTIFIKWVIRDEIFIF